MCYKTYCTIHRVGDSSLGLWFQLGLNLLLVPDLILGGTKNQDQKSILY